jgi:hypothetical protein
MIARDGSAACRSVVAGLDPAIQLLANQMDPRMTSNM